MIGEADNLNQIQVLPPQYTSFETAYQVVNYPYGFRLRCKIRYWIETKPGHGQRLVLCTTNPKKAGEIWNQPKAGTYSPIVIMYLDHQKHLQTKSVGRYASEEQISEFEREYALALATDYHRKTIRQLLFALGKYERKGDHSNCELATKTEIAGQKALEQKSRSKQTEDYATTPTESSKKPEVGQENPALSIRPVPKVTAGIEPVAIVADEILNAPSRRFYNKLAFGNLNVDLEASVMR